MELVSINPRKSSCSFLNYVTEHQLLNLDQVRRVLLQISEQAILYLDKLQINSAGRTKLAATFGNSTWVNLKYTGNQ